MPKETIYPSQELKDSILAIGNSKIPKVKFAPMAITLLEQAVKERNRKKKIATPQQEGSR